MSRFMRWAHPAYVRMTRRNPSRRWRATPLGRLLQFGLVATATLGLDTDATLSYQIFALLLALLLAARLAGRFDAPVLALERRLPAQVTAGETFCYRIRIRNASGRIQTDLRLDDIPVAVTPDLNSYLRAREPLEDRRNAWDRFVGFHRFLWLQQSLTGVVVETVEVPDLPIGGDLQVEVNARALRRGLVRFQQINASWPDPLGLLYRVDARPEPEKLLVLPRRYRLPAGYRPPGGRHYQPGGASRARSAGESDEFVALRDYREGDMVRRIHWPSTAKADRPVVKEFQDEYRVRQALLLDNCGADPELLEEAVSIAASFAVALDTTESNLDLMFVADGTRTVTIGQGHAQRDHLLEVLAGLTASPIAFDRLSRLLLAQARVLSGCLLVLTGWDAPRRELAEQVARLGLPHQLLVVARDEPALPAGALLLAPGRVQPVLDGLRGGAR